METATAGAAEHHVSAVRPDPPRRFDLGHFGVVGTQGYPLTRRLPPRIKLDSQARSCRLRRREHLNPANLRSGAGIDSEPQRSPEGNVVVGRFREIGELLFVQRPEPDHQLPVAESFDVDRRLAPLRVEVVVYRDPAEPRRPGHVVDAAAHFVPVFGPYAAEVGEPDPSRRRRGERNDHMVNVSRLFEPDLARLAVGQTKGRNIE